MLSLMLSAYVFIIDKFYLSMTDFFLKRTFTILNNFKIIIIIIIIYVYMCTCGDQKMSLDFLGLELQAVVAPCRCWEQILSLWRVGSQLSYLSSHSDWLF